MRKYFYIVLILICFLALSNCVTMRPNEFEQVLAKHNAVTFENEDLIATLSFPQKEKVNLQVKNDTDSVITLVVDLFSFTTQTGENNKLLAGETRQIDSNKSQPVITIAPRSHFNKDFYIVGSVDRIPNNLQGSSFVFGYRIDSNEKYILFYGNNIESTIPINFEYLGTITVHKLFWNILFLSSIESRQKILYDMALKEASRKYGPNIVLKNVNYEGYWSAISLVLYLSLLGFVEEASISADVVR